MSTPLSEAEARMIAAALEPRLARLAGTAPPTAAPLYAKEALDATAALAHEVWAAFADALEPERIEVVLGARDGELHEVAAEEIVAFAAGPFTARMAIFTRDFKFIAVAKHAGEGTIDATIAAPERFLQRMEEEMPRLARRRL